MPTRPQSKQVSVERTITGSARDVFAILRDPARHHEIDGSDSLLPGAARGDALVLGSVFETPMRRRQSERSRVALVQAAIAVLSRGRMRNRVVHFEADRSIAWQHFGRHVWRYDLDEHGDGSVTIRESFDYRANRTPWLLEWAGFPAHNEAAMRRTLHAIERAVARQGH